MVRNRCSGQMLSTALNFAVSEQIMQKNELANHDTIPWLNEEPSNLHRGNVG